MITAQQRVTRTHPCVICGGHDQLDRGRGVRCWGFLSDDGKYAHCTRDEHAGELDRHPGSDTYAHRLEGTCNCGALHDQRAAPVVLDDHRPGLRKQRESARPLGTVETYHVYYDPDGRPVHRTVRYQNPKDFRQERYDRGGWRWGLNEYDAEGRLLHRTETVLYHLPELIGADARTPIFLTEGERDADRLAALGLVATTNPCGSSHWESRFSLWLSGRPVAIVEDNDAAGRLRTARILDTLCVVASSVRVLSFPGLEDGGDVSDWLDAGGTKYDLLGRLIDTPRAVEHSA